ncbi:MAG: DUF348 domain-containing protein [Firmicutes bacterium]|nr:DUF348 domain-containing protein [Bacillota bacterium]
MDIKFENKGVFVLCVLVVLSLVSIGVYDNMVKDVFVVVDGEGINHKTTEETVKDVLNELEIDIKEYDYINQGLTNSLTDETEIIIKKAVPVKVKTKDKELKIYTTAETVKEMLDNKNISYDMDDKINPSLKENIKSNMEIEITEVIKSLEIKTKKIPFSTLIENNENLEIGKEKVKRTGESGIKKETIKKVYENGELIREIIVSEEILKDPVAEILEKGQKDMFVSSRGKTRFNKTMEMNATAYDLSYQSTGKRPGDKYYGITASGTKARPGVVAVDPRVIPLGTKLYVKSLDGSKDYGFAIAEDTGSAIKGNRIDLFYESHSKALAFGRRKVKVYILD